MEIHAAALPQEQLSGGDCTVHTLDLCDAAETDALMQTVRPDAVLHLAAQSSVGLSWKMPQKTVDINISGTLHLLCANPRRERENLSLSWAEKAACLCLGRILTEKKLPMPVYFF